jgi:hypothetical protein
MMSPIPVQVYSRKTRRKSGHQQTTVYGKQTTVVGLTALSPDRGIPKKRL